MSVRLVYISLYDYNKRKSYVDPLADLSTLLAMSHLPQFEHILDPPVIQCVFKFNEYVYAARAQKQYGII